MLYYTDMTSQKDNKYLKELSKKLTEAREKLGLTQKQVADKAGMDVTYYSRIERGEINTKGDKLLKLSEVLKVKIP